MKKFFTFLSMSVMAFAAMAQSETIIWEGEQSCGSWDGVSLRFSDYEGNLPFLSDEAYDSMVGQTMLLDIKETVGDGCTIRVTNGWWSELYVEDTVVNSGDTFSFEFTEHMANQCKRGGEAKDLLFVSNNGLTITKFYYINDVPVSLQNINNESSIVIFNYFGQKVNDAKGIAIVNGQKVMIK